MLSVRYMSRDGRVHVAMTEAAERTGHPVRVLRLWARKGRIPAVKVGRSWYVAEDDLPKIEAMPKRKRGKRE